MSQARTVVGASVLCYIDGGVFGRAIDFSFQTATPRRAIYGIDSLEPVELAPTQTKVSGTLRVIRTIGDGGSGDMTGDSNNFEREKYFSIALVDRNTDTVFFQAKSCSITSQNWSIPSKGHVSGTITFDALGWVNELSR